MQSQAKLSQAGAVFNPEVLISLCGEKLETNLLLATTKDFNNLLMSKSLLGDVINVNSVCIYTNTHTHTQSFVMLGTRCGQKLRLMLSAL